MSFIITLSITISGKHTPTLFTKQRLSKGNFTFKSFQDKVFTCFFWQKKRIPLSPYNFFLYTVCRYCPQRICIAGSTPGPFLASVRWNDVPSLAHHGKWWLWSQCTDSRRGLRRHGLIELKSTHTQPLYPHNMKYVMYNIMLHNKQSCDQVYVMYSMQKSRV